MGRRGRTVYRALGPARQGSHGSMRMGHRRRSHRGALLSLLIAALCAGSGALSTHADGGNSAGLGAPVTQAQCDDVSASVTVFHPAGVPGVDWREELAFDGHGGMWVSPI